MSTQKLPKVMSRPEPVLHRLGSMALKSSPEVDATPVDPWSVHGPEREEEVATPMAESWEPNVETA